MRYPQVVELPSSHILPILAHGCGDAGLQQFLADQWIVLFDVAFKIHIDQIIPRITCIPVFRVLQLIADDER